MKDTAVCTYGLSTREEGYWEFKAIFIYIGTLKKPEKESIRHGCQRRRVCMMGHGGQTAVSGMDVRGGESA